MSSPSPAGAELLERLRRDPIDVHELAKFLDGLTTAQRIQATRAVGRAPQKRLYQAVAGFAPVQLADLVPSSTPDLGTVRHFGKNTLPLFSQFEKRFCRPADVDPEKPAMLYGFNYQSNSWVTGPGYFVAYEDPTHTEVLIDYRRVPSDRPTDWPEIKPNERGLSRFVYGNMVDTLRRVSEHVTIGSAARGGRDLGSWFLLCRET